MLAPIVLPFDWLVAGGGDLLAGTHIALQLNDSPNAALKECLLALDMPCSGATCSEERVAATTRVTVAVGHSTVQRLTRRHIHIASLHQDASGHVCTPGICP